MSDYSSSNNRLAKNTFFLSIRMVLVLVLNLFTTRIVLQSLGVVDYGVYNVVCGFVAMFGFLNTSMSNGIQRFYNYEYGKNGEDGANKVYCTSLYIQLALSLIVLIIVEVIGLWYINNKLVVPQDRLFASEWIFQFSIMMFVLGIMQAPFSAAITAHERMDFYALISILDAILKLLIAYVLLIVSQDRLIFYGALMGFISLINFFAYLFYCKKNFREIHFKFYFDKPLFKSMLYFSGWNLFGSFSGVMVTQGINLVINFFFGPIVNAARGIAFQVNGAVQSFVSSISVPVRPQVTQSYARGDISRTVNLTYGISKISCFIVIMVAIPASFEIDFLLHLWLGNTIPQHTNSFTILVLITSLVTNLNWATSGIVHATGIMKNYQVWGSLVKLTAVPISFIMFAFFDYPEIALIIVLLCEIIAHSIGLIIVSRLVGISIFDYFKKVVLPIILIMIITLFFLCPVRLIMPEGITRFLTISGCCVVVVGISMFYVGLNKKEKKVLIKMAQPVLGRLFKDKTINI